MRDRRGRSSLQAVVFALVVSLATGCQAARLHAKDLLYHSSAAVRVPSWTIFWLFTAPPTVAWLPVSGPVLAIVQGEPAIWFTLAPGILVGGPILFLIGTPIRWIVGPSEAPADDPPPKAPPGEKKPG